MGARPATHEPVAMTSIAPFMYVDSDLPAGMTLADWRHAQAAGRPRTRTGLLRRMLRLGGAA
jgi:hypothetical protein